MIACDMMNQINIYLLNCLLLVGVLKTMTANPISGISNTLHKRPETFCANLPFNLSELCDVLATPEHFCGPNLSGMLGELCGSNFLNHEYSDDEGEVTRFTKTRFSRGAPAGVANECCKTPCSKSHLIYYYCNQPHVVFANHLQKVSTTRDDTESRLPNSIKTDGKDASADRGIQADGTNYSGQVRASSVRGHGSKGRCKRICRCRQGRKGVKSRKWKRRGKLGRLYAPHRIGEVEKNPQPFIIPNNGREMRLTPLASDNTIIKENWLS